MGLDQLSLLVRLRSIVWEDRGAEISIVDRVMNRHGDLEASLISKERAGNAGPHRLGENWLCEREK